MKPLPEECMCTCHVFEVHGTIKHTVPCCRICQVCGKGIVIGYETFHFRERHQPGEGVA